MDDDNHKHVKALIAKAAGAHDSADAQRFAQAACNAANALLGLRDSLSPPAGAS